MNLAAITREFHEIPIALIDEPVLPSRSTMDEQKLDELVASIRVNGLIEPISVVRVGGRYEVIAGHRRRIACGRAGLAAMACLVYPSKDARLEAIKYGENRHREELSPADEAIWFFELLERDNGGDVDALAAQLGETRAYIEGRLLLLSGDEEVFKALEAGDIGVGVAQQLNRCGEPQHRRMLLWQAKNGGATVALVSGWISEWKQLHEPATRNLSSQAPAPALGPVLESHFFTCALCGKETDVHLMVPVNMHTFCKQAQLDDMRALWNRRHEYVRYPRTVDEASALVVELAERFPIVPDENDPRRI